MAQKKRITHIGFYDKSSGNKSDELPFDVHSIMEEMDKGFDLTNHNKHINNSDCLNVSNGTKTSQILHAMSTENSDAEKKAVSKFKNILASRKYPLMEKSQKVLNHLRHNRSIPKPRAHLTSILKLPNEDNKIKSSNSLKDKKDEFKKKRIAKKKITKKRSQKVASIEESPQEDIVYDNISKNSVLQNVEQSSEISKLYFNARSNSNRFYSNDLDHSAQQSTNDNDSNDDTTDSEFEKFIKHNKINFKKVSKKKNLKKKRIVPKRVSTHLRESIPIKNVPEYCNSNFQDICANAIQVESNEDKSERAASQNVQCEVNNKIKLKEMSSRKSKCLRKSNSIEDIPKDYHLSENFSDRNCQDIFGNVGDGTLGALNNDKSEMDRVQTCNNEYVNSRIELKPNNCQKYIIKEFNKSHTAERERITDSSETEIDKNPGDSNIISTIQNDCPHLKNSVLKLNVINLKDGISRKDSDCEEAANTACELPFNIPNSSNVKNSLTSTYQGSNNQTSSEDVNVIDLCDSDTEDENTEIIHHFRPLTQNQNGLELCEIQRFTPIEVDSDIEIIDIKPISNSKQIPNSEKINSSNLETSKNCNKYNEENHSRNYAEHSLASAIPHIKTDAEMVTKSFISDGILNDLSLPVIANFDVKTEKNIELRKKICENNNPVFMTDICKDFIAHESSANASYEHLDNSLISANSSITQCQNNKCHVIEGTEFNANYQSCVNNTIKNEVQVEEHIRAVDSVSVKEENAIDIPQRKIEKCSDLNRKNSYSYSRSNSCDVNAKNNFSTKVNPQTLYNRDASGSKSPIEKPLCDENSKSTEVNTLLAKYKKHFSTYENIIMAQKNLKTRLEFFEQQERNTLLTIANELQELAKSDSSLCKMHSTFISSNSNSFKNISECDAQESQEVNIENLLKQSSSNTLVPIKMVTHTETSSLEPFSTSVANSVKIKSESQQNVQTSRFFGKECVVCKKEAVAACQNCVKVFYCSNECGMLFWNNGHEDVCGK